MSQVAVEVTLTFDQLVALHPRPDLFKGANTQSQTVRRILHQQLLAWYKQEKQQAQETQPCQPATH